MDQKIDWDSLIATARRTACDTLDDTLSLHSPTIIKRSERSVTLRCHCTTSNRVLDSLFVKQIISDEERGYDDWASLEFLTVLPTARDIAPRFYGGDSSQGIYLMEDLGSGRSIENLLDGDNRGETEATLQQLAIRMAQLAKVTRGQEELYSTIRQRLPSHEGSGRAAEGERWRRQLQKALLWLTTLDIPAPLDLTRSLEHIGRIYDNPGEFLVFSHGDPAPSNNLLCDGEVRLLDFEYGAHRHVLYDISGWYILCPLPEETFRMMNEAFQSELSREIPSICDEKVYRDAFAAICAWRTMAMMTWIGPEALEGNQPWVETWSKREALLAALQRLKRVTDDIDGLVPIHEIANALLNGLLTRWGEYADVRDICPRWKAFTVEP